MAKYDKETKFYWLQLKEDFFEEDSIEWLEEQENGHKYSLFYLKLCLKSLKSNGILVRKVGNMLVPYDNKKLAEMTKMPVDTVIVAMELLKGIGLVEVLENGELYITQLEKMIGSTSKGALKKQQQRALQKENQTFLIEEDNEETKGGHLSTKDKDKDKDKIKDKEINKKKESKKENNYDSIIEDLINDEDIKENIYEFIKMRKLIKKPMTDRALKQLINRLYSLTSNKEEQLQILDNSIINNWANIYPLKNDNVSNASNTYKRQEIVPELMNKEIQGNKPTTEEQKEMEDILKQYDDEDFEARKKALQEKLKNKYGK